MSKEEQILVPMIRDLEASATLPDFHCGTLRNPIRIMEMEHDDAQQALSRLRELTRDYAPPEDSDELHRAAVVCLAELDADLRQHISKESDILFPRAVAEESARPDRASPALPRIQ
jgi:regulator of cell morphogenesis and NO signaling